MDIDKIPVLGKINRTFNAMIFNFILLAVIFVALAIAIMLFPTVLQMLVSILLILSALVFVHLAYNIYSYKKKYTKWFK
jgi:Ca2+/Na+ antiporter